MEQCAHLPHNLARAHYSTQICAIDLTVSAEGDETKSRFLHQKLSHFVLLDCSRISNSFAQCLVTVLLEAQEFAHFSAILLEITARASASRKMQAARFNLRTHNQSVLNHLAIYIAKN